MTLFDDLPAATLARDTALTRVAGNAGDWFADAVGCFRSLDLDATFTGEDIANRLRERIGDPHHPNVFGSLTARLVTLGLIRRTGDRRPMRNVRSRARWTAVYERL